MFYNIENLFDTIDCNLNDDEFLPQGERRWNTYKYYRKLENIFKVMRVDAIWRLSYLDNPNISKFGIRFSLQFLF